MQGDKDFVSGNRTSHHQLDKFQLFRKTLQELGIPSIFPHLFLPRESNGSDYCCQGFLVLGLLALTCSWIVL